MSHYFNFTIVKLILCLSLSACGATVENNISRDLISDTYLYAKANEPSHSPEAFIILSNLALGEMHINQLIADYEQETDEEKLFLYEFVLAKRMQDEKYINAFIERSSSQIDFLAHNNTDWVSLSNPVYEHLKTYVSYDDRALATMMELAEISDGANLSIIGSDLLRQKKNDPIRFSKVLDSVGLTADSMQTLLEED